MDNVGILISTLSIVSTLCLVTTVYKILLKYAKPMYIALIIHKEDIENTRIEKELRRRLSIVSDIIYMLKVRLLILPIALISLIEFRKCTLIENYTFGSSWFNSNFITTYGNTLIYGLTIVLLYNTVKNTIDYFQIDEFRQELLEIEHQLIMESQKENYKRTKDKN